MQNLSNKIEDRILVAPKTLAKLINQLTGGYQNPDDPLPHGPWDPVIRRIFEQMKLNTNLNLESPAGSIALASAVTQKVVADITTFYNVAEMLPREVQENAFAFANNRLSSFIDEYCGNGRIFNWPPRPKGFEIGNSVKNIVLLAVGAQLVHESESATNQSLQRELSITGSKLIETSISKI